METKINSISVSTLKKVENIQKAILYELPKTLAKNKNFSNGIVVFGSSLIIDKTNPCNLTMAVGPLKQQLTAKVDDLSNIKTEVRNNILKKPKYVLNEISKECKKIAKANGITKIKIKRSYFSA